MLVSNELPALTASAPQLHSPLPLLPAHRDRHSVPTRRSSDLEGPISSRPSMCTKRVLVTNTAALSVSLACRRGQRHRQRGGVRRSEEHTSELQSPYDIVCRLLLEKKKFAPARKP